MNKANKCKTILFKSEDFHTGQTVPVYCGMIASDWDGKNPIILLCSKCKKRRAKKRVKK